MIYVGSACSLIPSTIYFQQSISNFYGGYVKQQQIKLNLTVSSNKNYKKKRTETLVFVRLVTCYKGRYLVGIQLLAVQ